MSAATIRPLALITGASSGIGAAFARALASQGYDLVLVARRAERLHTLKIVLEARHGVQVEALPADLTQDGDLARVEQRLRAADGLALLVNSAGFDHLGDFVAVPLEKHLDMLRLHLEATIRLCHAALPALRRARRGGIIIRYDRHTLKSLPRPCCKNARFCGMLKNDRGKGML